MVKSGIQYQAPNDYRNWRMGSNSSVRFGDVNDGGDWREYLPGYEKQHAIELHKFDSQGCTSFSALNALEIMLYYKYGIIRDYSDKWLANISGTTVNGNTFINVAEVARGTGLVLESSLPFDAQDTDGDGDYDWSDFYPPQGFSDKYYKEAGNFQSHFEIQYHWVEQYSPEDIVSALQFAPLQVAAPYPSQSNADEDGVIHKGNNALHAFVIVGYEYKKFFYIYDTYAPYLKKISWDYSIRNWCMQYDIIKKDMDNKPILKSDSLITESTGTGRQGFYHPDGYIIVDEAVKIHTLFLSRATSLLNRHSLSTRDFNKFEHRDSKNNIIWTPSKA
jgi:hypothetical protein